MNIAVIGVGHVGGALAEGLAQAGHRIFLGVRQSDAPQPLAERYPNVSAHPVEDAASQAEVLLIAATPSATADIAARLGDVSQKVIIDAMNSISSRPDPYANTTEALRALTNCPHVVKCFNSTGYENMAQPRYGATGLDMFVAGNSAHGKSIAQQLARDIGFEACYDFGGDDKVALLEQLALAWINLAIMQKHGRDIAFKIIRRPAS